MTKLGQHQVNSPNRCINSELPKFLLLSVFFIAGSDLVSETRSSLSLSLSLSPLPPPPLFLSQSLSLNLSPLPILFSSALLSLCPKSAHKRLLWPAFFLKKNFLRSKIQFFLSSYGLLVFWHHSETQFGQPKKDRQNFWTFFENPLPAPRENPRSASGPRLQKWVKITWQD